MAYDWPGNVRELQRTLEGALAHVPLARHRPRRPAAGLRGPYAEVLMPSLEADDTLRAWASRYARLVLARSGHNKRRACRALGISYHTLQAYLRYGAARRAARDDVAQTTSREAPAVALTGVCGRSTFSAASRASDASP